ncbi:MAG: helix-turn-helix transcriptional regulator [Oculatellaceae cyanobacterium bins.114]|nr:helix-turn-helix transcriptional regulator [Oculatellaceae cyanobacterium bins.114]
MRDEANPNSVFVQLRRQLKLTQKNVADELGISEQTVRNWENGKTTPQLTIPQMKRLCNLLQRSLEEVPDYFGPIENADHINAIGMN